MQDYLKLVRFVVSKGFLYEGLQQQIIPFLRFREEWKLEAFYLQTLRVHAKSKPHFGKAFTIRGD